MENYKKDTFLWKSSDPGALTADTIPGLNEDGKIPIGLLHYDPDASEYLDRVEERLKEEGIR